MQFKNNLQPDNDDDILDNNKLKYYHRPYSGASTFDDKLWLR